MSELKGICPNCGVRYYGRVLTNSLQQKCARRGSDLEIAENGIRIQEPLFFPDNEDIQDHISAA